MGMLSERCAIILYIVGCGFGSNVLGLCCGNVTTKQRQDHITGLPCDFGGVALPLLLPSSARGLGGVALLLLSGLPCGLGNGGGSLGRGSHDA